MRKHIPLALVWACLIVLVFSVAAFGQDTAGDEESTELKSSFWSQVDSRIKNMTRESRERLGLLVNKRDEDFSERNVMTEAGTRGALEIILIDPVNTYLRPDYWDGTLRWEERDEVDSYTLSIFRGNEPILVETNLKGSTYNIGKLGLVPRELYSWKVEAQGDSADFCSSETDFDRAFFAILSEDDLVQIDEMVKEIQVFTSGGMPEDRLMRQTLTAVLYCDHGLYLEASELLRDALDADPTNVELAYLLAQIYEKTNMKEEYDKLLGLVNEGLE